jgi:hypothetical protein
LENNSSFKVISRKDYTACTEWLLSLSKYAEVLPELACTERLLRQAQQPLTAQAIPGLFISGNRLNDEKSDFLKKSPRFEIFTNYSNSRLNHVLFIFVKLYDNE